MLTCPECGAEVDELDDICPECFAELDEYQLGAEGLGDEADEDEQDPFFDDPLMAGFVTLVFFGDP